MNLMNVWLECLEAQQSQGFNLWFFGSYPHLTPKFIIQKNIYWSFFSQTNNMCNPRMSFVELAFFKKIFESLPSLTLMP